MPDVESARQLIDKIVARKLRKGYVMVESPQEPGVLRARAIAGE